MLAGKKITAVRAMSKQELAAEGWNANRHGPVTVLELDDGSKLYAAKDPEGNGPGALFMMDTKSEAYQIVVK